VRYKLGKVFVGVGLSWEVLNEFYENATHPQTRRARRGGSTRTYSEW